VNPDELLAMLRHNAEWGSGGMTFLKFSQNKPEILTAVNALIERPINRKRFRLVRGPCGQYDSIRRGDEQILVGCTASRLGQQAADVGIELSKDASAGYLKGSGDQPQISFDQCQVRRGEAAAAEVTCLVSGDERLVSQENVLGSGDKLFVGVSQESLISRGQAVLSRPQMI
jgi:hypothetical protein